MRTVITDCKVSGRRKDMDAGWLLHHPLCAGCSTAAKSPACPQLVWSQCRVDGERLVLPK